MMKLHTCVKHVATLADILGVTTSPAYAAESDPDGGLYEASADPLADVQVEHWQVVVDR